MSESKIETITDDSTYFGPWDAAFSILSIFRALRRYADSTDAADSEIADGLISAGEHLAAELSRETAELYNLFQGTAGYGPMREKIERALSKQIEQTEKRLKVQGISVLPQIGGAA